MFRVIGEQCLARLNGPEALANYRSSLAWQAQAKPLWLWWAPALVWAALAVAAPQSGTCRNRKRRRRTAEYAEHAERCFGRVFAFQRIPCFPRFLSCPEIRRQPARNWEYCIRGTALLWGIAAILVAAALGQTALHLVPPCLPVGDRTLSIARKHLVQAGERSDFEYLAAAPLWRGQSLKTLLEHVELAHYNRELVNWKLDDQVYREFVLSPIIAEGPPSPATGTLGCVGGGCCGRTSIPACGESKARRRRQRSSSASLRERVTILGESRKQKVESRNGTMGARDRGFWGKAESRKQKWDHGSTGPRTWGKAESSKQKSGSVVCGQWSVVCGPWSVPGDERRGARGEGRGPGDEWQVGSGPWSVVCGQ